MPIDPRVRQQFGGRGPLMTQPFQNPLARLPAVPNPWAGMVNSSGPMALLIQQAAAQQRAAAGQPQQSRPVIGPSQAPLLQRMQQSGASLNALGQSTNPLQEAFNWANAPQRHDEPKISALLRNGGATFAPPEPNKPGLLTRMQQDVGKFYGELMTTPDDFFMTNIVRQESGGRQVDAQGNPLVGRDRQGRVPGADRGGAAIGAAQIQEATARNTAKAHGIPWDANKWKNDKNYNLDLGRRHYNDLYKAYGGDHRLATAAYHSGEPNVNKAVAQHGPQNFAQGLGPEGRNYVSTIFSKIGPMAAAFGAPAPGFDAAPYQNAMGAIDQAAALRMKPIEATFTEAPIPDRPKPTEFATPNFAEGDAAFAATAPTNPFDDPKEKRRMQWSGYAKGIGQALASMSGNEGFGTMLMKIGGMALAGRKVGDEQIVERQDKFDRQMQDFNRALANREDGQAATIANVLNQNIQQTNQYADTIWSDNAAKIAKKNPQIIGDNLVTYEKRDPNDPNTWTMISKPISNIIAAEALISKANLGVQMGQASAEAGRYAHGQQQGVARTMFGLTVQQALAQNDGGAATEGYGIEAVSRARAAVNAGTWRNMLGGERGDTGGLGNMLESDAITRAYAEAGIQTRPIDPDKPEAGVMPVGEMNSEQAAAFREKKEDFLTANIFEAVSRAGTIDKLYNSPTGRRAQLIQRSGNMRTTTRTGPKGTTVSQNWEHGE